jgi:hypothetical protein
MSGSDDGALFRLSPAARSRILTIVNSIKSEYMEMIQSLSLTELKSFNKHTYKEMMIPQMKKLLPDISDTIISSTCHYISNALNNESQNLVGQHKRNSTRNKTEETVSTSTTKTDTLLAQVDDLISIYSLLIEFSIVNILDLAAGDKRNSAPSSDPDMLK